jgi:hypothetical protein
MSTFLKKKPTYRRKRAREPMVDGDVDSAEAVTHTRVAETQNDGTTIIKHIVESLDNPSSSSAGHSEMAGQSQMDAPTSHDNQMPDWSPPNTPRPRKSRVSIGNTSYDSYNNISIIDAKGLHFGICISY